jgi:hypothetical protein
MGKRVFPRIPKKTIGIIMAEAMAANKPYFLVFIIFPNLAGYTFGSKTIIGLGVSRAQHLDKFSLSKGQKSIVHSANKTRIL